MSETKQATIDATVEQLHLGKAIGKALEIHDTVDVAIPEGVPVASIRCSVQLTKNLGNYSSIKVDVSVTTPCLPSQVDTLMPEIEEYVKGRVKGLLVKKEDA